MGAISETGHRKFLHSLESQLSEDQRDLIEDESMRLRKIYREYTAGLSYLRMLLREYAVTRKDIKLKLRKSK